MRLFRRSKHNDYDYECEYWFGDRSPAKNYRPIMGMFYKDERRFKPTPLIHREMSGRTVRMTHQRCSICNPYTEAEGNSLLGWS